MKTRATLIHYRGLGFLIVAGMALAVRADWDPTQEAKWIQLPDESPEGLDVKLFNSQVPPPLILADDFLCTQTGPITDIHIWGSWLYDMVPDPEGVSFVLSIYSDIPAGPAPGQYSRPGDILWQTEVTYPDYTNRVWTFVDPGEGWYDPALGIYEPEADRVIWQYNFFFDPQNSFIQEGSPEQPIVYWLAVQALIKGDPAGEMAAFGWKTSATNWNDDAVWAFEPGQWNELVYPVGHPLENKSIDLAFVITTIPAVEDPMDYGDAPEGALAYPATGTMGAFPTCKTVGPSGSWIQHGLGWARFGQGWDAEFDGNAGACPMFNPNMYNQDECFADGDAGLVYPEGFTISGPPGSETVVPCVVGPIPRSLGASCQTATWGTDIELWVINNMPVVGYVNVLMDWDQNGAWGGMSSCSAGIAAPEHVLVNFPVPVGYSGLLSPLLPPAFTIGPNTGYIWSRFSVTERPVPLPWIGEGIFEDGETEDYLLWVKDLDFGDAPGPYPTLLINNGARHLVVPGIYLGAGVDAEPDGQPSLNSDGDDLNTFFPGIPFPPGDEDGVKIPKLLSAGMVTNVEVVASVPGYLNAWIDWNVNGTWIDPGEHVYVNQPLMPGTNILPLNVPLPPMLAPGGPHSRWRFTTYPPAAPTFTGAETDGEVEDYEVHLIVADFGDAPAPYPTTLADNGAYHLVPSRYWLGATPPDHEPDGQPHPQALGDDINGIADEDGVTLIGSMVQGASAIMNIQASTNTGYLNAWVDFDQNGSWGDPGEHIFIDLALVTGGNMVTAAVPAAAKLGQTFARFRFSSYKGLPPTGPAYDGEIEDYAVTIWQRGPSGTLFITNIVHTPSTDDMTIQWPGEAAVTYEAEYSVMDLADTNIVWNAWGGNVIGAPYEQVDTSPAETTKFYRVTAPYSPPPP